MECPRCGAESMKKICEFCGCEMPQRKEEGPQTINNDNSRVIINNYYQSGESPTPTQEYTAKSSYRKAKIQGGGINALHSIWIFRGS